MLQPYSYGYFSQLTLWQVTAGAPQTLQMLLAQQFGSRTGPTVTPSAACTLISGNGLATVRLLPAVQNTHTLNLNTRPVCQHNLKLLRSTTYLPYTTKLVPNDY